jgi:hypothetical protein
LSSDFLKSINEKPVIKNPYMTGTGIAGSNHTTYGHYLTYKKTGLDISFVKYGDKDTFQLKCISIYKRNRYVTIDNVSVKGTIRFKDLDLTKDSYIETERNGKRYGLIKKGNIKYYINFQPKDKVSGDTKFKIKLIEIYCT